jgi:hypothetical protein
MKLLLNGVALAALFAIRNVGIGASAPFSPDAPSSRLVLSLRLVRSLGLGTRA